MSDPPRRSGTPPELSDGVVVLRPRRDGSVGFVEPVGSVGFVGFVGFMIEHDGDEVGSVDLRALEGSTGEVSWALSPPHTGRGHATRAVRLLVDHALSELGLTRVEARVDPENKPALRVATRAGLRREGVVRGPHTRVASSAHVLLGRLADDPPVSEPEGFRELLNSFLPRKRAIAQMLVRSPDQRVLLCQLTYKNDWDLPGGVVEVSESPRLAVSRELVEELALDIAAGPLLLTDWLPAWSGWDDAVCLVFDGGVHDESILRGIVKEPREIRSAAFCSPQQVRERCADFTARRIEAALANSGVGGGGGPAYTESGR